jgi:3-phenylpropionate/trans-cinnamate dioxygenase ferredoxin reductase subunit
MSDRIVIIGAGQAGVQAVTSLRAEGFAGELTLVGDEPYPPYQRPPLSKAYLAGTFERERLFLKPESFFQEAKCDLRLEVNAVRIDREGRSVHLENGGVLPYTKLLLTTGARSRRISIAGSHLTGIYYLRGIDDVDRIRPNFEAGKRLVIVGGGYIGLEVAAVAVKHGLDVTVLEAASRVMERAVSPVLSEFSQAEHAAHGVEIRLGTGAKAFEGSERVERVVADGGAISADLVLVGVGAVPNIELAKDAGLEIDNGIVVDEFARTSDANIFAAGDCTNHPSFVFGESAGRIRLESVQNAIDQAKHAASSMVDKPKPYSEVPWFWSDQYDIKLQIVGLARAGDALVQRGDPAARSFAVFHIREDRVAAVEAVNAASEYVVGRRLIGAGTKISPERLADTGIAIKSFLTA